MNSLPEILLALLSVLLPFILKRFDELEPASPIENAQRRELRDLADALQTGDTVDIAAVWAEHDRRLSLDGLGPRPSDDSGRGFVGDDLRRRDANVLSDVRMDASSDGSRAKPGVRIAPVRRIRAMTPRAYPKRST